MRYLLSTKTVFKVSVFISVLLVMPRVFNPQVFDGQTGKQAMVHGLTLSYLNKNLEGIYPLRPFPEIWHSGVVPWAEEVPLYSLGVAALAKLTHSNLVVAGKAFSFFMWVLLSVGLGVLVSTGAGKNSLRSQVFWLAAAVGFAFPVFKIYGSSFMPDLSMATCLVWAFYFALKHTGKTQWVGTGAFAALACMFKYYAVFSVLGIGLYFLWQAWNEKARNEKTQSARKLYIKKIFSVAFWGLAVSAPTLFYLWLFLKQGVPNPITEYSQHFEGGHFGARFLLKPVFYSRLVTWNIVKNPGIVFGVFALVAMFKYFKRPDKEEKLKNEKMFFGFQFLTQFLFMGSFSSSFFVHDYYGLMFSILLAYLVSFELNELLLRSQSRHSEKIALVLFFLGWGMGISRYASAVAPQDYYSFAQEQTQKFLFNEGFAPRQQAVSQQAVSQQIQGIFFGDRAHEAIPVSLGVPAYIFRTRQMNTLSDVEHLRQKLLQPEIHWVAVLLVDSKIDQPEVAQAFRLFSEQGWKIKEVSRLNHQAAVYFLLRGPLKNSSGS